MQQTYKRKMFDRFDGWRVRNVDAVFSVIPFFLRTRVDSQNFFEASIPLDSIERFIRENRAQIPELATMHVVIAALVRLISQKPQLNRFVVWNKIYAHNDIRMSLIIKRAPEEGGEETLVKPAFEPTDTIHDVVRAVADVLNENLKPGAKNSSDDAVEFFGKLPSFIVRPAIGLIRMLDNVGKIPRMLHEASPWHCSMFLTNMGSLGIGPVYHHLYEFGTCSQFIAMGNKTRVPVVNARGEIEVQRVIGLKFVTDERICDGQYYASAMKLLKRLLTNPALLLEPPAEVFVDDGVGRPRADI